MSRAAIFFDRDNTLIANDGYLGDPRQVVLIEGAADAVAKAKQLGFVVVTVSNQSGVARGLFTEEDVIAVDRWMEQLLIEHNQDAVIDHREFCPFHPDGKIEKYRRESPLRKPAPGMILLAAGKLDLDLKRSWLVGDAGRDIEAGAAAGCQTILFQDKKLPPSPEAQKRSQVMADYVVGSLVEAMHIVEKSTHI